MSTTFSHHLLPVLIIPPIAIVGRVHLRNLNLQTQKLVAALIALDADIVGLMELENNGFT